MYVLAMSATSHAFRGTRGCSRGQQPGGASLLRRYAVGKERDNGSDDEDGHDADWAFGGGINKHSQAANRRMRKLRVAKVQ